MKVSIVSIVKDYQIIVSVLMIFAAWRWGDWRNWKSYYPTMLFFALGDFVYGILTYNHPLWEFESPILKTTLSDLLICLVFFPATVLVYVPNYPTVLKKQILYVLLWIIIYTVTKKVSHDLGFFSYHNGWNIWWSILFNFIMFPTLILHHKKPLWALLISAIVGTAVLVYFKVPFSSMK